MKLIILIIMMIFVGCSDLQENAGGSATETTNGIVVLTKKDEPANNAKVKVFEKGKWLDGLTDQNIQPSFEGITDSTGFIEIPQLDGQVYIYVESEEDGSLQNTLSSTFADTLSLEVPRTIYGLPTSFDEVWVIGTEIQAKFFEDSSFILEGLPIGDLQLALIKESQIQTGPSLNIDRESPIEIQDTLDFSQIEIQLADFDSGDFFSTIEWIGGQIGWYIISEEKMSLEQDEVIQEYINEEGNALRREFDLSSQPEITFSGIGMTMFSPGWVQGLNLSNYDQLTFKVRGHGILKTSVESKSLDDYYDDEGLSKGREHYARKILLYEDWYEIEIDLLTLQIEGANSLFLTQSFPLSESLKDIQRIEWSFEANSVKPSDMDEDEFYWFEIADIKLKGNPSPLW